MSRRRAALVLTALLPGVLALGVTMPAADANQAAGVTSAYAPTAPRVSAPRLRVRTVVRGLENPWDVQPLGNGSLLVTERDRARLSVVRGGQRRTVRFPSGRVWVSGETGLMSLATSPGVAHRPHFWTCQGWSSARGNDIRVSLWRLDSSLRRARLVRHLVTGLPTTSGRHGGCRLILDDASSSLFIGTGDAAESGNSRDLTSLGGKVLRVDRRSGDPWPDNPFIDAANAQRRYVYTFGHRNVQGLAQRPSDGRIVSVEHGPDRDDEVNALVAGGDYGWNPGQGYDENVPMTDQSLPGFQRAAIWTSGYPTIAASGAAWVTGTRWRAYDGTLAVAALKGERVLFLDFDKSLRLRSTGAPAALRRYGRLRSVTRLPGGDLLLTTSNGSDDKILRVSPR